MSVHPPGETGRIGFRDMIPGLIEYASSERFAAYDVDKASVRCLETLCEELDYLFGKPMEQSVEVDDTTGQITLTVYCPEFNVRDGYAPFFTAMSMCDSTVISACRNEEQEPCVAISFTVPGVWVTKA